MDTQDIRLSQITLAANRIDQMQIFYNVVFGANFKKYELQGHAIYEGQIGGIPLTLVPNDLLGVKAKRNRFQFDIEVPEVEKWVNVALAFGGKYDGEEGIVTVSGKTFASMLDPDGNSIVIMQATAEAETQDDHPPSPDPDTTDSQPAGGDIIQTLISSRKAAPKDDDDDIDFIVGGGR